MYRGIVGPFGLLRTVFGGMDATKQCGLASGGSLKGITALNRHFMGMKLMPAMWGSRGSKWFRSRVSGPCPGMVDSKVAGSSVPPFTSFKGAGLSLPNTGGSGWLWFLHASILSETAGPVF